MNQHDMTLPELFFYYLFVFAFSIYSWQLTNSYLYPDGQMVHCEDPGKLNVPFSQDTGEVAGLGHLNPAGHWRHSSCPSESVYVPLRQGMWVDSLAEGQCDPAGHRRQSRLPPGPYVLLWHGIGSESLLGHLWKRRHI